MSDLRGTRGTRLGFLKRCRLILVEEVTREWSDLLHAFRKIGAYALAGLSAGIGLIWLSEHSQWLHKHPAAALVCEHLGLGLIVSSIAVFFYEYKAHTKHALDLADRLERLIKEEAGRSLARALEVLLGSDRQALPSGAEDLPANFSAVVLSVSHLVESDTRVSKQYVSLVSSFFKAVVARNTKAFRDLSEGRLAEFRVPASAAELADDVLAAQMRAMGSGDQYDVVSDLCSWREGLRDFAEATRGAVKEGVLVRRIFNLFREEDKELKPHEIEKILLNHLQDIEGVSGSGDKGRYEVRVFGEHERRLVNGPDLSADIVRTLHFGIFTLDRGNEVFKFKVTRPDLSEMMISRDRDDIANDAKLFDLLWDASSELSREVIARIRLSLDREPGRTKPRKKRRGRRAA